jgi:hypothetical protein
MLGALHIDDCGGCMDVVLVDENGWSVIRNLNAIFSCGVQPPLPHCNTQCSRRYNSSSFHYRDEVPLPHYRNDSDTIEDAMTTATTTVRCGSDKDGDPTTRRLGVNCDDKGTDQHKHKHKRGNDSVDDSNEMTIVATTTAM